jgi:hypothetical protein
MRAVVIGAAVAAALSLAGAAPAPSAPANGTAIGQAAAEVRSVTQVRCWCTRRDVRGVCQRVRCS